MKITFDADDNLPLNKQLKLHMLTKTVRSVFEEGCKLYPQLYLDDVCMSYNNENKHKTNKN